MTLHLKPTPLTPAQQKLVAAHPKLFVQGPKKVTVYPHPKAEPDLDQIVLALLRTLDEMERG